MAKPGSAHGFTEPRLNVCFERIRAEEKAAQDPYAHATESGALAESPETAALGGEIMKAIDEAVRSLPPRQRAIFALKQYNELRFSEIAALLDITEGGAKGQLP